MDRQDGVRKCTTDGKLYQKDENGKVKTQFERYALRTLMSKCLDFAGEQSAMEYLLSSLTEKARDLEF